MKSAEPGSLDARFERLQRQLRTLRWVCGGLVLAWMGSLTWTALHTASVPSVLAVERLEIVEPDGKPREPSIRILDENGGTLFQLPR